MLGISIGSQNTTVSFRNEIVGSTATIVATMFRENQIPRLSDMLLEAEYSLSQRDYKQTIYKIAKFTFT